MRRIDKFYDCINKIKINEISDFNGIDVTKILYLDIWNMLELSPFDMLKRFIAQLFFNPLHITEFNDSIKESKRLAIEIKFGELERLDNTTIFNNLYNYYSPCKHILITKKYKFSPKAFLYRLVKVFNYSKYIKNVNTINSLYLSSQLIMVYNLLMEFNEKKTFDGIKSLLIFQDNDTISSAISQTAHLKSIKVISPQHGQPMNRHANYEQLFFEGFQSDYKLLWNDFSKNQFLSAGISEKNLFVVGNSKMLGCELKISEQINSNVIGLIFDCPLNDGGIDSNFALLHIGEILAEKYGKMILVKLHPYDSEDRYNGKYNSKLVKIADKKLTMLEFEKTVDFAIAHITGAIIDFIYDGKFVFIYDNGEPYPIYTDDIYKFKSVNEFFEHYESWKKNIEYYCECYKKIRASYYIEDAEKKHIEFFKELSENGL